MKRTKKAAKAKPLVSEHVRATVDATQLLGLLDRVDGRVQDALRGCGVLRGGVPFTYIPNILETLADLSYDLAIVRHCVEREVTR